MAFRQRRTIGGACTPNAVVSQGVVVRTPAAVALRSQREPRRGPCAAAFALRFREIVRDRAQAPHLGLICVCMWPAARGAPLRLGVCFAFPDRRADRKHAATPAAGDGDVAARP